MVTYCYAWTPLAILATLAFLALPWLGLIALMVVLLGSLVVLAGLTWVIAQLPLRLSRGVHRRWRRRSGKNRAPAAGMASDFSSRPTRSLPAGATALITNRPSSGES
jgi:hypothetical protein